MALKRAIFSTAALLLAAGCATTGAPTAGSSAEKRPPGAAGAGKGEPAFRLADFEGRDGAALDALLGEPALVRREGEGEFRRYMLDECALLVILYPDDNGERRVARLDAGALVSGAARPDLERCLAAGKRT